MKKEYTPVPYTIRDKDGHHVSIKHTAEAKADYLATRQWGRVQGPEKNGGPGDNRQNNEG